jgi:predicted nucleic acid-binding protein
MAVPPAGLLDTSVFIATEAGRAVGALPAQLATSVVVVAELSVGVLTASDPDIQVRRQTTLDGTGDLIVFPIDESVAQVWADMRAHLAESGRRVNVNDLWIAATAAANRLPVVTQDADFDPLEGVAGLEIVRV